MGDAIESAHMGHPDFRAYGKIFATIHPDQQAGMVKLSPEQQELFVRQHPLTFAPENGAWGRAGCTRVHFRFRESGDHRGSFDAGVAKQCAESETETKTLIDLQPILKGDLLELRPLRPEDFHVLFAVASDPLIWELHPNSDRYKEEVFQGFFRDALESGGALIALDRRSGQVIGSSRFHGYMIREKSEIEIGWNLVLSQVSLGRHL